MTTQYSSRINFLRALPLLLVVFSWGCAKSQIVPTGFLDDYTTFNLVNEPDFKVRALVTTDTLAFDRKAIFFSPTGFAPSVKLSPKLKKELSALQQDRLYINAIGYANRECILTTTRSKAGYHSLGFRDFEVATTATIAKKGIGILRYFSCFTPFPTGASDYQLEGRLVEHCPDGTTRPVVEFAVRTRIIGQFFKFLGPSIRVIFGKYPLRLSTEDVAQRLIPALGPFFEVRVRTDVN